mmetsp:Transcript_1777/g.3845  ORF Transcript_1777/g.3845 Transcript_1777/m.3845 type:complete len:409 (-) Transcript_1777:3727-4953(-)
MFCCGRRHKSTDTLKGINAVRQTGQVRPHPYAERNKIRCAFCGGRKCRSENFLRNPRSIIRGLNSDWITPNVMAMQRPSSRLIREFQLTTQFQEHGIKAIVNLQMPGEHPYCGDGVLSSGFSYLPEELYAAHIFFYSFGWPDMTAPSEIDFIFGAVKVMAFTINAGGKVAVHCHAGTGRTCMAIACYLVYNEGMTAHDAIALVKSMRKSSLKVKDQRKYVASFENYLKQAKLLFGVQRSLKQHLDYQTQVLHGVELKALKNCPKLVDAVVEAALVFPEDAEQTFCRPTVGISPRVDYVKNELNKGNWKALSDESAEVRAQVLLAWLAEVQPPVLTDFIPSQHTAPSDITTSPDLSLGQKEILRRLNSLCTVAKSSDLSHRLSQLLLGQTADNRELMRLGVWLRTSEFT